MFASRLAKIPLQHASSRHSAINFEKLSNVVLDFFHPYRYAKSKRLFPLISLKKSRPYMMLTKVMCKIVNDKCQYFESCSPSYRNIMSTNCHESWIKSTIQSDVQLSSWFFSGRRQSLH
jgi:hypothetical protein